MVEARFDRVEGGYLLNGQMFIADYDFDAPEQQAIIADHARELASAIDKKIADQIMQELRESKG